MLTPADESGLALMGILAFRDPAKADAAASIAALEAMGVSVRLITGDDRLVAAAVGRSWGSRPRVC
ncbi:hypothetical protein [Agromyces bauzanensis]|uniref:HAD family hydrolase n=1 Tax=Agromyces bauzanensis TaxID=1308924 RepID=A0A917UQA7_9MICO|nr:hypothetical protein [Agromyces bauzanensis]GGJ74526.1 hypothetical protein GCM10011372_10850 [Agromyces bauzanensis]